MSSIPPSALPHVAGQDTLKRDVTAFQSFAIAFGFVSIATGIFTAYGAMLATSGPMGIWTWPIVVIGQLMVAFVLGSLSARIPITGYAYQWTSRVANPVLGWVMGWSALPFWSSCCARWITPSPPPCCLPCCIIPAGRLMLGGSLPLSLSRKHC
ncbi:amino acid permease [Acetobacter papayae]|uniref:amino acid permease n=1 Tax=Acetobacter papayae TaxID=1076592 RepID=UPI000A81FB70|nr:amino acid permease [Acetobacter papayae]